MKDVLTALTTEIFKPLMTVVLPGAVSISTALIALFIHFERLRDLSETHRVESGILMALMALVMGEVLEDIGSRIEYRFDRALKRGKDESGNLKFPEFDREWDRYLLFDCERNKEPVAVRYIRTLLLRMKFELGMLLGFSAFAISLWFLPLSLGWKLFLDIIGVGGSAYFCWEAKETHELLASTRHLMFGLKSEENQSTASSTVREASNGV